MGCDPATAPNSRQFASGWPGLSLRNPGQQPHTFDSKQVQPLKTPCTRGLCKACRGFEDSTPATPAGRTRLSFHWDFPYSQVGPPGAEQDLR